MDPKTETPRRGVAMFVVLGAILFVTLLGVVGLTMAGRDSEESGSLFDMKTRDAAARAGITLALARMQANPAVTMAQLNNFIADSSLSRSSARKNFTFDGAGSFTLTTGATAPFYILGTGPDVSAAAVEVVSIDFNQPASGAIVDANGIMITLRSMGRGRNGDQRAAIGTFQLLGLELTQTLVTTSIRTIDNALYVSGDLKNTNIANNATGDVYVSGEVLLNSTAPQNINGRLLVNGVFKSNAALTVTKNSWIGGEVSTNGGAPLRFYKNLGLGGGLGTINTNITVDSNLNIYGSGSITWSGGTISAGKQLYVRNQYMTGTGNIVAGGNAFFYNSISLTGNTPSTFGDGLYVDGNTNTNSFAGGNATVNGNVLFNGNQSITTDGNNTFRAKRNLRAKGSVTVKNNGGFVVDTSARFDLGIADITVSLSNGISVGDKAYLYANPQYKTSNGGLYAKNALYMKGTVDANFSNGSAPSQWNLSVTGSKIWQYENGSNLGWPFPRVWNAPHANVKTPFVAPFPSLVTVPVGQPYALTSANIGMSAKDTTASLAANPPDTLQIDSATPAVKAAMRTLTDAMCLAAGAPTNNWNGPELDSLWVYFQEQGWLYNGYMLLKFDGTSSMSNFSNAGTFHHKGFFLIEKDINVNGKWPSSANSNCIQVINIRGASGVVGQFGSQGDFYGVIFVSKNPGGFTQSWGPSSHLYGTMEFALPGASYTGNSGKLDIAVSPTVISDIMTNLPGALRPSSRNGTTTTQVIATSQTLQMPSGNGATRIQFLRVGEYR